MMPTSVPLLGFPIYRGAVIVEDELVGLNVAPE
jgi:hypothetical protein